MSTDDDRRIYKSARPLIELYRLNPDRIEGTGKEGSVTKGDVEAYLRGEQDEIPAQQSMAMYAIVEGLENEEIADRIKDANPDTGFKSSHVSLVIGHERRRDTAWWNDETVQAALREHRPQLKGVDAPALDAAAASQPAEGAA